MKIIALLFTILFATSVTNCRQSPSNDGAILLEQNDARANQRFVLRSSLETTFAYGEQISNLSPLNTEVEVTKDYSAEITGTPDEIDDYVNDCLSDFSIDIKRIGNVQHLLDRLDYGIAFSTIDKKHKVLITFPDNELTRGEDSDVVLAEFEKKSWRYCYKSI